MRDIGHFVGGKPVAGTSGRTGDVFNPNTGEVQAKVALASKAEVESAIANAQAAFPGWAATNPQRRARVMFKFLELIQAEYGGRRIISFWSSFRRNTMILLVFCHPSTARPLPTPRATSSAGSKWSSLLAAFRIC
jgi:hypothetical protein